MKIILKTFKWIGKILAGLIILLIISGACYRLFSSKPVPPGKLVDVNGTKLHIIAEGDKNDLPTLILESGAGGNTDMFHWIAEGLKKNMRVIRYDREGKWFSESSKDSITPEFYAKQLHALLEKNGEKPPYILVGHSMGGPYNRIFRDLYPDEVKGLVFLDSSHPEQWKRLEQKELIPKEQIKLFKFVSILADMGILGVYNKVVNSEFMYDGLPKDCHIRSRNLTSYSGEVYRRNLKENDINDAILSRSGQATTLDSLPILVFTATEQYNEPQKERYRKKGIDPDKQVSLWFEMQKELKELSTNGKQFILNGTHGTIITKKENAEKINKEIRLMSTRI
ncbi:alpha/beta hydrolase [Flavobacterium branchiarum]|uniref:Alpha/beta fold hydrolase n=1 Tax=Flavobacterium branchiarum TaxID=1114870 RepID=A0ABV5FQT4_9FLAO|nr:alpha/beta hydrolase [Flavobacterium branchiarum]MDN3673253.1 alpha/beta hydrolase [Flavobacterium branchiarum]